MALLCFELLIPKGFLRLQKYGGVFALLSFVKDELSGQRCLHLKGVSHRLLNMVFHCLLEFSFIYKKYDLYSGINDKTLDFH